MTSTRIAHTLTLAVSLLASGAAHAQPAGRQSESLEQADEDVERARLRYELGRVSFERGQFDEAAEQFSASYELAPRPELLYNMFLAYRDGGRTERAADALVRYLVHVPEGPRRQQLEARLRVLQGQARGQEAAEAGTADAVTEGEVTETEREVAETERERTEPAHGETSPAGEGVGQAADVLAADDTRETPAASDDSSLVPWLMVAGGGALLAGGAVTGVMALSIESDLVDRCPDDTCDMGRYKSDRSRGVALALVTDVLLVAGAASTALGLVLLLTSGDSEEAPPLTAACGPAGCSASLHVRY